ncbi:MULTISPECIES: hypothetical protein [unclassified Streptomyces]|uniref:hypothetical protein n=1 Tax=unclassified Streptomyces TaxID=2593676 RepID=UPI00365CC249
MRRSTRFTRYTVPAVLCTALLAASPGLATAADSPARPPVAAAAGVGSKAIPGTEALLAQVQQLGTVGGVLKPVTDLLAAVFKSPDGKLPEADVAGFKEKIDTALTDLRKNLPPAPAPAVPAPPVAAPQLPVDAPKLPVAAPEVPVDAPKLPVDAPKLPVDAPELPVAAPEVPVDAPKLPVDAPKLPVDAPKLPVAAPQVPVDAPKLPADAPNSPVAAPKLPAGAPEVPADAAKPPVAAPKVPAVPARAFAGPLDVITAAIDKLEESVGGLLKTAGPCGCSTDAKAKATDVLTSLVAALVALLTGLGLPGLPPLPVPVPVP